MEKSLVNRARHMLNRKMTLAALLVVVAIIASGFLVLQFAEAERARDMYNWQVRMGLVADRQASEVSSWVEDQFSELSKLSENQSLQLYMTELEILAGDLASGFIEEPAEATFLKNLLTVTAKRGGFLAPVQRSEIKANIKSNGVSGITIINNHGSVLVSTRGMPIIEDKLASFVEQLPKGKKVLLDMYKGASGEPTMAFVVPVYSIQGDHDASQQMGIILGVKPVAKELFPILKPSYTGFKTAETIIVRAEEGAIEYISPLMNGKAPLSLSMAINTPDLIAAEALKEAGAFLQKKDYRFRESFATGRRIEGTPWVLIHKIDSAEAMADSDARLYRLLGIFILAALVIFVGIIAAWRHGSSIKSEKVALRYKNLFNRFKSQEHLLRLVSDNQPDAMFLVDSENRYCYANNRAAKNAGTTNHDVVGKSMSAILGPVKSNLYRELNAKSLSMGAVVSRVQHFDNIVLQTKHIPLDSIPNIIAEEETPGVLVIEQDITELVQEREKQERTLEQLINSLVALVDRHDPYAAHHSSRVSKLAKGIAEEMGLDNLMIETSEVAGRLMNVGKILLPAELLAKKDGLNQQERQNIHDSIYASAEFLKDITFEGPIVETIQQCLEHWDGTGPKGMKGEEIIIPARIVAVANAFVAMTSPRAYREEIAREDVLQGLLNDVGKKYQRSVVGALINYIENRDGDHELD
jgi:PAS domain S-box-containing protein